MAREVVVAPAPVVEHAWMLDTVDVVRMLGADLEHGLTSAEAERRLAETGPNVLEEPHHRPAWLVFVAQFTSTIVIVLLVAAGVMALLGDLRDTLAILAVVLLNGIVGFVQEYRAEGAMEALERMTSPRARAVRDGRIRDVSAHGLVPGDVVVLATGDVVGADLRLVDVAALRVNEATLTGESEPVAKTTEPLPDVDASLVAEHRNMAFTGTAVTYGRGVGVVVATGMATELGRIAGLMQEHAGGRTPLQRRLASLGRLLALVAIVLSIVVFAIGLATGEPADQMFLTAVSLAVSAIPEGLPIMVTVALALGARRMAGRRALIRTLPTVETLGSVNVICTDKTGTLTQSQMVVERIWTPAGSYRVTGEGYAPDGTVIGIGDADPERDPSLARLIRVAAACNDARLHAPTVGGGPWTLTGDPTEGALLALAGKRGVFREEIERDAPRIDELAFDAGRRRMTTVHRIGDARWVATKGALEALLPAFLPEARTVVVAAEAAARGLSDEGYRVLAFAEKTVGASDFDLDRAEWHLALLGLVGVSDPPRPDVREAISACGAAGIVPVMVTGDDARTAVAVARRVGLLDGGTVLTGAELEAMDDETFAHRVEDVRIYARTNPEQKLRIVDAWKARGQIVAMTGDGVNDAPALRSAHIGVAMGVTGTEVSKEAADMILADDDFSTLEAAVEEGRRIYDNIRKFLRYMLATNSGELWLWIFVLVLGMPIPLLPLQILWVNLLTDGLPSVALGVEPVERGSMRRPPRPIGQPIWGDGLWQQTVWLGLLMGGVGVAMLAGARAASMPWQTMVFTTMAFLQLGHALTVRSDTESAFRLGVRSNPWIFAAVAGAIAAQLAVVYVPFLQTVFDTETLTVPQIAIVLSASTVAFGAVEADKWIRRRRVRT